ncbi:MAG: RNA-guided pseudouridylation complex pseudouridine synthase subunit Cbf5, partial [Nanoarchaeota archaeon]
MTGCLPIALDRATRIVQVLLKSGKEYVCLMYLHDKTIESKIHKIMKGFVGKIKQIPPVRSAVKRQERIREIYYIDIIEIDRQDVLFRVGCEAGTYIRKLVHDVGKEISMGAHMKQLVRTKVGSFTDKDMISLHDLKDAYEFYKEGNEKEIKKIIKPFEDAVEHLPKIWVLDSTVNPLCHGADLYVVGISKLNDKINKGDFVAIFTLKNELI